MERRHFLKLAFGFAAGGIALAASAQAAPLMPAPLADEPNCPSIPMPNPPSRRARRSIASRRRKCAGAAAVIAAGAAGTGVGAAAVGVAGIGAGIAAVVGAAATGVVVATTGKSPPGLFGENKKSPARAGLLSCFGNINKRGSVHSATRCHKGSRDRDVPPQPAAPPHAAARPQLPGEWVGICRRDREPSPGRILARLPLGRSWQRCPGPKLLRKGTSCFLPFLTAWAARLGT